MKRTRIERFLVMKVCLFRTNIILQLLSRCLSQPEISEFDVPLPPEPQSTLNHVESDVRDTTPLSFTSSYIAYSRTFKANGTHRRSWYKSRGNSSRSRRPRSRSNRDYVGHIFLPPSRHSHYPYASFCFIFNSDYCLVGPCPM